MTASALKQDQGPSRGHRWLTIRWQVCKAPPSACVWSEGTTALLGEKQLQLCLEWRSYRAALLGVKQLQLCLEWSSYNSSWSEGTTALLGVKELQLCLEWRNYSSACSEGITVPPNSRPPDHRTHPPALWLLWQLQTCEHSATLTACCSRTPSSDTCPHVCSQRAANHLQLCDRRSISLQPLVSRSRSAEQKAALSSGFSGRGLHGTNVEGEGGREGRGGGPWQFSCVINTSTWRVKSSSLCANQLTVP